MAVVTKRLLRLFAILKNESIDDYWIYRNDRVRWNQVFRTQHWTTWS